MSDPILKQILTELQNLNQRLSYIEDKVTSVEDKMASKEDIQAIQSKLDVIHDQVVRNSEQSTDLSGRVSDHETDIRLIKRVLTNQ